MKIPYIGDHRRQGNLWLISYVSCLLIPWMLVASRSFADALCIVISLCFLLRSIQQHDWTWTKDPIVKIALIAWIWMLVAVSPFAADVGESYKVALPWVRWILMYAALRHWILLEEPAIKGAAFNIAALALLSIIDTLWQYRFGTSLTHHAVAEQYRLTGPMVGPKIGIFLAKLCFPTFGIFFYLSMGTPRLRYRIAALCYLALCIGTVMLSGERTAFFSSLVGLFVVAVTIAITDRKLRRTSLGLLAIVIGSSLALLMTQLPLQDRLMFLSHQIADFGQSAYGQLFQVGYWIGMEHWQTGAGFKGFRLLCLNYQQSGAAHDCNIHPHNPYIEWFAETGAFGLCLFVALIAAMVHSAIHYIHISTGRERVLAAFVLATLVVHFFPFLGTQSFFSNWPALLLWYSVSMALASLNMIASCDSKN